MAITVNTTDTFEQWRVKTNQLGSDVDSNIASVRADITSNVVTINTNIAGNVTAVRADITSNVNNILANIASLTGNVVTGNLTVASNARISSNITILGNALVRNNLLISSGNVGIGTNAPQQLLDVRGRIQVSNGTNGGQLGVNAGGLAISSIGAAPVSFYYNTFANESMRIDEGGNVGIGTTSPGSPLTIKTDTDFIVATRTTAAGTGARIVALNAAQNAYKDLVVDGSQLIYAICGTERMRIDDGGNVNVGTRITMGGTCDNLTFGRLSGSVSGGTDNFFAGYAAGNKNTTGNDNNFLGRYTGSNNTTGAGNNFFGESAGGFNSTGCHNTFFGNFAGCSNTTGCNNIFIGLCAGRYNLTGGNNIFAGLRAGYCNTSGDNNFFAGRCAGFYNETGDNNFFAGQCAGYCNSWGYSNTFLGQSAGLCNLSGHNNIFLGSFSGSSNVSGQDNVFLGSSSGRCNLTGGNNVFMGYLAGFCNSSGSNNIFIGANSGICLACTTTQSGRIVMGNPSHTLACIQVAWSVASDVRDKCIFGPVPFGKSFLRTINPITYSFKNRETNEISDSTRRYGFCAQEILALEGNDPIIVRNEDENHLGMSHDYLIPVLVNAVKELSDEIDELRAEIQQLKSA
jgi:hypothetical protein